MSEDRLAGMYQDQRSELEFRRTREQAIFAWSTALSVALIAWSLTAPSAPVAIERLGALGPFLPTAFILFLTAASVRWQLRQRHLMRNHQRVLASLARERGWFAARDAAGQFLFPAHWRKWGTRNGLSAVGVKVWVTTALGLLACIALTTIGLRG